MRPKNIPLSYILLQMSQKLTWLHQECLSVKETQYMENIVSMIGNDEPILCMILQREFWLKEIYEPWVKQKQLKNLQ